LGAATTNVNVNLIEDPSRAGQSSQQNNRSGGMDITVFVDRITAENGARPGSETNAMLRNAGVQQRVVRRS
jgi:hypothetical protein